MNILFKCSTLIATLFLLMGVSGCQSQETSISPLPEEAITKQDVSEKKHTVPNQIIIGFKKSANQEQIKQLLASVDGVLVKQIGSLDSYLVKLPQTKNIDDVIQQLSNNDLVVYSEKNHIQSKH